MCAARGTAARLRDADTLAVDICYATTNRQRPVTRVLVVGSSNSRRLGPTDTAEHAVAVETTEFTSPKEVRP
ncbi:hypothetical protein ACTIVE_1847 [Actinomadura verrucosospora]|uniref:Uncharacterized protein n=1 Tax=Actinomadura verrucosospora TaxID=46165 RepID=A0A7D4AM85_ACTVE|nr:hypothetical protein ACTIVE_1847 [Actinomadura verrucosospora]